ncbi:AAA domain-containing protein [Frankia sp. AiPa1]|uniref:AAA domain-containing protein n=1 Tax=Frankia sp. AiPa1 TaxID=573492 RepID=UPI00202AC385|nr:AAA domain-containing protein [Frankia sp. AiPa1]MCL9761240.1 AAA domain-containing protein [Frankia sp. AiPa1]
MTADERRAALADRCYRLVRFLHELALARGARVRTVEEHPLTVWLADLPSGVPVSEHAGPGEVLLTAPGASSLPPAPPPPAILAGHVLLPDPASASPDRPPALTTNGRTEAAAREAAYREWLPGWRVWASRARADTERRALHNTLNALAGRLAQEGDALELVLATGLLTWQPPDGPPVREHLLSTRVRCEIDPVTSDIRVRLPANATTRLTDGPLLDGAAAFHRERTNNLHERLRNRPATPLGPQDARLLREWLTLALDIPAAGFDPQTAPPPVPGTGTAPERDSGPRVTFAPALVLRVRDSAALLSYCERMLDALRGDGPPPLGLAQLVATLDTDERIAWLAAEGATEGALLGADPLLPLPTSPEQSLVLERLRHDNGVVVEGPPGTGKTHTIANLISALLAEGQRVLVTSQKAQALRVLRAKLPAELRDLCVSLTDTDGADDDDGLTTSDGRRAADAGIGAPELAASVSALAAERAGYRPETLDRRIARATTRRDQALRDRDTLAAQARAVRADERTVHPRAAIAPGWAGTRAGIAARVRAERPAHDWMPRPVPAPQPPSPRATAPRPPLTDDAALELYSLLLAHPPHPTDADVPVPGDLDSDGRVAAGTRWAVLPPDRFAELVTAGDTTRAAMLTARAGLTARAASLLDALAAAPAAAAECARTTLDALVRALDRVHDRAAQLADQGWVRTAVDDALAEHNRLVWAKVDAAATQVAEAARHLADLGLHEVALPPAADASPDAESAGIDTDGTGTGTGDDERDAETVGSASDPSVLLAQGEALRAHFEGGGGLRRRFKPKVQRAAEILLAQVTVDGLPPTTPELLDFVLLRLRAGRAVDAAGRAWALAGHPTDPGLPIEVAVSRLWEQHEVIERIGALVAARDQFLAAAARLAPGYILNVTDAGVIGELAAVLPAEAPANVAASAQTRLDQVTAEHEQLAAHPDAPGPLAAVAAASRDRDPRAYSLAVAQVSAHLIRQRAVLRRDDLLDQVRVSHPALVDLLLADLRSTANRPAAGGSDVWAVRLGSFGAAWSWALAADWLHADGAAAVVDLDAELDAAEDVLAAATAELAGARAWRHCLGRLGAEQSAALRAYTDAVAAGATLGGQHAERYRQAAREAMALAQTAVPAWVMPIREVLSTIPPVRDSFDVVIVDEGSQAGLDSLFLLWLAPRVIVVGDDRQCTPPEVSDRELDDVFDRLDALLPDVPAWLRVGFSPRSSLFSLLRTRFGEVVRLREHFRCMPEIIEWSSAMFYREAPLVPLRQFGADRLPPLLARHVLGGSTTPTPAGPRNRAEAEALVGQVLTCAEDPRYVGLSFGVVVVQGQAQAALIRDLLAERMSSAEHRRRRLRVGTPADFQGDERHVVFVSLVVAPATRPVALTRLEYQRRFNVAASRARDQVWLFHSVTLADLDHRDLRHSYLGYVLSVSRTGLPTPDDELSPPLLVPEDRPHPAFGSLFAQRVYRRLAERGYLVTPGLEIGGQRIDLVVSGGRARFAIGCDDDGGPVESTDRVAAGIGAEDIRAQDIARSFERERDLRRAGWQFWRVRQSDFELDPDTALATLWPRLTAAGIEPRTATAGQDTTNPAELTGTTTERSPGRAHSGERRAHWRPIALSDLEGLDDAVGLPADLPGQAR